MFPWELRCGEYPGKPSHRQLSAGASTCSPKGAGNQKLSLDQGGLKLAPVCEEGRGCVQGTVPCQLSCCHQSGENHGPLPRALQLWGGEEEPKVSPSVGQGGHM